MYANNPHSVDRAYKFIYKMLGIKFHKYFYGECEKIEFIETEIPDTGQRKDMTVIVDKTKIHMTEFMTKALYDKKLKDIFEYHEFTRMDPQYKNFKIQTDVISIANPRHGKSKVEIDKNILFYVNPIFTKEKDGWKILNKLTYKTIMQEELSEAIDLLLLPDMDIQLPSKQLMSLICSLTSTANIPDKEFKKKIILCEIQVLHRFFKKEETKEMIKMLNLKHPEVERIIQKYREGFDTIYFNGKKPTEN